MLNFFRMAAKMSGERVDVSSSGAVPLDVIRDAGVRGVPDVDGLATVSGRSAMVALFGTYQDTVAQDPTLMTRVVVRGVPAGVKNVRVREWRIDETHSNAYTVWKWMGSPAHPEAEQMVKLEGAGKLQEVGAAKECGGYGRRGADGRDAAGRVGVVV